MDTGASRGIITKCSPVRLQSASYATIGKSQIATMNERSRSRYSETNLYIVPPPLELERGWGVILSAASGSERKCPSWRWRTVGHTHTHTPANYLAQIIINLLQVCVVRLRVCVRLGSCSKDLHLRLHPLPTCFPAANLNYQTKTSLCFPKSFVFMP